MDILSAKYRRETVKQDIINKVSLFIDKDTRVVNMREFFKQNPYYRNKLQYYFGTMPEFYEEIDARPEYKYIKKITEQVSRRKTKSVRDQLAAEQLDYLREQGFTLQEIGDRYGISKQAVNQLITMLDTDLV